MLKQETIAAILNLQKRYPQKRSALIPALHLAQAEKGYLPVDIQQEVANLFGIDASEVHGLVTFYDMFYEKPVGKHVLHVCKNVSCMLKGADEVMKGLCHKLNVQPGEMTQDGQYTLIASECLGACDLAPMLLVDDEAFGPAHPNELDQILEAAKRSPGHPSAMQEALHE